MARPPNAAANGKTPPAAPLKGAAAQKARRCASGCARKPRRRRRRRSRSAGEIAARIAGKRAEDAATKKNGKGKHEAPRELTPADIEARKRRLKTLIVLGKERGFLTYAEINDHLPDDLVDADQIEGVISMIGDMGIQVYDEAPDADTLLMSDTTPTAPTEDVEEEAEAAASTLDSEFGRTTDPVRMYMREMGSVELLTREGEIEIAKRIEEGLKHMIMAISACPMTVGEILDLADRIAKDELKIDDLVDGLMDFDEGISPVAAAEVSDDDAEEAEEDEEDAGAIAAENLERLRVAALERFASMRKHYTRMLAVLQKEGHKAPRYLELQKKISAGLMQIRFSARMVEKLCDSVRTEVDNIRQHERKIQDLVVNKGGMPRPDFIKKFPEAEVSLRWIDREVTAAHPYSEQLARYRQAIVEQQQKLLDLQTRVMIPLEGPEGNQQADVDRRSERAQGQARDDRGQPAPRDLDRQEVHQPRPAVPRPDPGRQHRPDEGGRQVRIPPRLQVLDVRDVVDPPGDHALDRRPGAHDPHPGAHDRDDQQDEPHLAADPAGDRPGARSGDARRQDGNAGREDPQDPQDQQGADLDGNADRRRRRFASGRLHRGPVDGGAVGRGGQRVACATSARTSSTR